MRVLGSVPCSHASTRVVGQHNNPVATPLPHVPARSRVVARSADDTAGVADLLARDRRAPKVQPELLDDKSAERFITSPDATTTSGSQGDVVKSRRKRREDMAAAVVAATGQPAASGPKKCKEAIDRGLELFQEKKYQEAIAMFNLALELPGNGAYRLPGSPREYSCPSDAEENAALYNMACAYAQLGQRSSAITCLEAVLDNGFTDYPTMRQDPDLQALGQSLQDLVGKYDSPVVQATKGIQGMFSNLMGNKSELVSDTQKKPWIMW